MVGHGTRRRPEGRGDACRAQGGRQDGHPARRPPEEPRLAMARRAKRLGPPGALWLPPHRAHRRQALRADRRAERPPRREAQSQERHLQPLRQARERQGQRAGPPRQDGPRPRARHARERQGRCAGGEDARDSGERLRPFRCGQGIPRPCLSQARGQGAGRAVLVQLQRHPRRRADLHLSAQLRRHRQELPRGQAATQHPRMRGQLESRSRPLVPQRRYPRCPAERGCEARRRRVRDHVCSPAFRRS